MPIAKPIRNLPKNIEIVYCSIIGITPIIVIIAVRIKVDLLPNFIANLLDKIEPKRAPTPSNDAIKPMLSLR